MPHGHYVSISATGPGPTLWYKEDGSWTSVEADRHIFIQVQQTDHRALSALPEGYRTRIVFETVG